MKSYEEMIQIIADNVTQGSQRLRYFEWPAYIVLAEVYAKTEDEVFRDMKAELEHREQQAKLDRKAAMRASNEERRLANIAKGGRQCTI
jgi:hypothetical protein